MVTILGKPLKIERKAVFNRLSAIYEALAARLSPDIL
jgi:hypothetical protein